jgi:hypothetical protein
MKSFDSTRTSVPPTPHSSPALIQQDVVSTTPTPRLPEGSGLINQHAGVPQAPAAFTPGPWKVGRPDAEFCGSKDFPHIVMLDYGVGPCAPNVIACRMTKANAHLIAASPEMYAELCDARDWVRHWRRDVEAGLKPTIESLRIAEEGINLALAKANGGNQ